MKKTAVLILLLVLSFGVFSQTSRELNIGGFVGTEVLESGFKYFPVAATVEYRFAKAYFSLNTDFQFLFYNNNTLLTVPLYLKVIIGNNFRVCPEAGGFVRTNGNYGLTGGLSIEYRIKKLFLFAKADYYLDAYKDQSSDHFGGSYEYTSSSSSVWIGIGLKYSILK